MIEIRIHGRGGQGAVTASELLAVAAFKDGKYSQAFPKFGPERTGAPVTAFCRISDEFITTREHIYEPDFLMVLDDSLIDLVNVTEGLKKGAIIVINTEKKTALDGYNVYNIDATRIALSVLGKPIVNTTILGAFVKATNLVKLAGVEQSIRERFSGEVAEKNIQMIKKAYEEMKI